MAKHNQLGKLGEAASAAYLVKKGYRIRDQNWHSSHFELDIVAEHNGWLVVVEVKSRSVHYLEAPERAVDRRKIQRIIRAAHHYICLHQIDLPVRFDVITVIVESTQCDIDHLEDAFLATHASH